MNKKLFFILPALALLLAGCNKAQEVEESKEETTTSESTSTSGSSQTTSESGGSDTGSQGSSQSDSGTGTIIPEGMTHVIHVPVNFTHFHFWEDQGAGLNEWPGDAIEAEDATWGKAVFNVATGNRIIFNEGGGEGSHQTGDLEIPAAGEWWFQIGTQLEAGKYVGQFLEAKPSSATYDNSVSSRQYTINVPEAYTHYYCWGAYTTAAWPGNELVNHQAVITVTEAGTVNIIFNDGQGGTGHQTPDLQLPAQGGTYTYNGSEFVAG